MHITRISLQYVSSCKYSGYYLTKELKEKLIKCVHIHLVSSWSELLTAEH